MPSSNRLAFLSLLLLAFSPCPGIADPTTSLVTLPQTEQLNLRSKSGLEYRIFLAGISGKQPEGGSPVIYLTDGNGNFPILVSALRRQSMNHPHSPAVIVGIGYPSDEPKVHAQRRSFDLTPLASEEWMKKFPKGGPVTKTGGNDQFLTFIEEEVKPLVEKKYKIDRNRQTLFGHSLGGLFALHVLFHKPQSFQTYLVSSPSIWWNDRSLLSQEKAFVERYQGKELKANLLLTVGEWEEKPGPKVAKEEAKILQELRMGNNTKELANRLTKARIEGLKILFREFVEEDHGSVVLPAASRGVRFALEETP